MVEGRKMTNKDPLKLQFGGDHYKQMKIQPVEYIMANNLNYLEGNAIKYITRHSLKGGRERAEFRPYAHSAS